jgi:perosamine synthetase
MRIRLASPEVGSEEIEAIGSVLRSGVLTGGPRTAEFEEVFAHRHQVDHAVAFANGTVALAAIYLGVGIGPGDEVIVPSMTFISSATSLLHVGATPVFADVLPDTFTLDPVDVARRITEKTRAILTIHYGGQPSDLDELVALARSSGVDLLEDAAQAHGASYHGRPVGAFGRAAMFSFTPTKNITTGEGGMVTTNDSDLAERLRLLRNHGQTSLYEHSVLGYNWRITEMQAAMGVVQMGRLDSIISRKRTNALAFGERLRLIPGVSPPVARADREHVYMLYTTLIDGDRDAVREGLLSAGIEARLYFPPAHTQPVFNSQHADLPNTDDLSRRMLSLPFHAQLSEDDLEQVAIALEGLLVHQRHRLSKVVAHDLGRLAPALTNREEDP